MADSYNRFSRVVEDYRRYRPRYPQQLVDLFSAECGFSPAHLVADIGSGTGLLAELLLQNGNRVYGVEPNQDMRQAAEQMLRAYPLFTSVARAAEATALADRCVDIITVGQAFHWFDLEPTRREFLRIVVPEGWVVIVCNLPRNSGCPFGVAFAQFWQKYIDSRELLGAERKRPDYITEFFNPGHIEEQGLDNYQVCDFEALRGRILSASRAPDAGDPR